MKISRLFFYILNITLFLLSPHMSYANPHSSHQTSSMAGPALLMATVPIVALCVRPLFVQSAQINRMCSFQELNDECKRKMHQMKMKSNMDKIKQDGKPELPHLALSYAIVEANREEFVDRLKEDPLQSEQDRRKFRQKIAYGSTIPFCDKKKWLQELRDSTYDRRLVEAVCSGSIADVKQWCEKGADPNGKDKNGNPILCYSVRKGSNVTSVLLQFGASPLGEDTKGYNALYYAAKHLHELPKISSSSSVDTFVDLINALTEGSINVFKKHKNESLLVLLNRFQPRIGIKQPKQHSRIWNAFQSRVGRECGICASNYYKDDDCKPHILSCGHHLCCNCFTKISECHMCRMPVHEKTVAHLRAQLRGANQQLTNWISLYNNLIIELESRGVIRRRNSLLGRPGEGLYFWVG